MPSRSSRRATAHSSTRFTFAPLKCSMARSFCPGLSSRSIAPVMMLAEFRLKLRDEFSQGFPVPRHHFHEQQRHHGGVALGQIKFRADAARLFSAQQNVALQHQFADVLEADRRLEYFAAEFLRDLVEHFRRGKSFRDVAGNPARARQDARAESKKSGAA